MPPSQARANTKASLGRQVVTHLLVAKLKNAAAATRDGTMSAKRKR